MSYLRWLLLYDRFWHWRVKLLIAAAISALGLSGCQGPTQNYLQHGIGARLAAPDIESSSRLLNSYFFHLCDQTGLSLCANLPHNDTGTWNLIVRQGMNDIDRRCDAYLEWLDDVKRSRDPIRKQVADVRTATTSIMSVVDPRSAAALQIVGFAFDLITRSLDNYHSRLLLEIESSTINSIVLRARHDMRSDILKNNYATRPDVEYALRSYLRVCLPFAIETNINTYGTLGARGIAIDERTTINQSPVIQSSRDQLPPVSPQPPPNGHLNEYEARLGRPQIVQVQAALCVEVDGNLGPATRAAVVEFYNGAGDPRPRVAQTGITANDMIKLREAMQASPRCNAEGAHTSAFQLGQLVH